MLMNSSTLLLAAVDWRHYMFMIPLILLSIFLILVILVQRGRGGGLTGALGGMGGQSAFGTKAGDLFTRITIVVAAIWVLLSMAALKVLNQYSATGGLSTGERATPVSRPAEGSSLPSATKTGEAPAEKGEKADSSTAAPSAEKSTPPTTSPEATPTATPTTPAPSPPSKTSEDTGAKPADSAKP
jgi:preprotein translocase subunit SecG